MFPSTLFSTGGDEINANCYTQDAQTQQELSASGKTFEQALDTFTQVTHKAIEGQGKTPVVWEGKTCATAAVMKWGWLRVSEMVLDHNVTLSNNTIALWVFITRCCYSLRLINILVGFGFLRRMLRLLLPRDLSWFMQLPIISTSCVYLIDFIEFKTWYFSILRTAVEEVGLETSLQGKSYFRYMLFSMWCWYFHRITETAGVTRSRHGKSHTVSTPQQTSQTSKPSWFWAVRRSIISTCKSFFFL